VIFKRDKKAAARIASELELSQAEIGYLTSG